MQKILKLPFWFFSLVALVLIILVTFRKVFFYNGNLTTLIGIWEGFYILNPNYFLENFVIHSEGGYDGQFFYLIARYLYDSKFTYPPILDSFELRFSRIGLSLLSGFFCFWFGFEYYAQVTFFLLWSFHFLATYLLYKKFFNSSYSYLYLVFLFSPFAWNSNFLLISDSLFASIFVFLVLSYKKIGLDFFSREAESFQIYSREYDIPIFVLTLFFLIIKETSLPIVLSFLLFAIWRLHFQSIFILIISIIFYLLFLAFVKYKMFYLQGTNPLSFLDLIDYPFLGFIKSFLEIQSFNFKTIIREVGKFFIFLLLSIQILCLKNSLYEKNKIKYLPLAFICLLMIFAEVGYWLTFDNVSRFLTISVPYIIFLKVHKKNFVSYGFFKVIGILFIFSYARMLK